MRQDEGFELEVTDPKDKEQKGEASEGEGKGKVRRGIQDWRWG